MPFDVTLGSTIELLVKNIDLRVKNHGVISANLANADTPGYVPGRFSFEGALKGALKGENELAPASAHPRHIPFKSGGLGEVHGEIATEAETVGEDGNGVSLEVEMGRMVENQIMYNASVQILAKKFEGVKYAIKGGS